MDLTADGLKYHKTLPYIIWGIANTGIRICFVWVIAVPAGFYTFEIRAVAETNPMVLFINESFTFYQADF
jgi:hypothetical protein